MSCGLVAPDRNARQACGHVRHACMQASQLSETLSTCRFAQRMMQVTVDAQKNKGGMSSVHGNLFKLDPVMQQYLEVSHTKQPEW